MGNRNPDRDRRGTLEEAKAQGQELWLICTQCGRKAKADLDALTAKLGGSYTPGDVTHHVHCRECNSRWPHIGWEMRGKG